MHDLVLLSDLLKDDLLYINSWTDGILLAGIPRISRCWLFAQALSRLDFVRNFCHCCGHLQGY